MRGVAQLMKGDLKAALASFDKAVALQPSLAEARLNRAVALLRTGELAKASADLQKVYAIETSAVRAEAAYHNAIVLDRLNRPAEAEQWLQNALALDPKLDAALLYAGVLRERRGDLQGAGRAYLDYLKLHPDSLQAMLRFGIAAQKSGRPDVAKTYLGRVIAAAPESFEAIEARKFLVMWE